MKKFILWMLVIIAIVACTKTDQTMEEFSEVTLNQEETITDSIVTSQDIPEPPEVEIIERKPEKKEPVYTGKKEYEVQLLSLTDHGRSLALQKILQDNGYETEITETYKNGQLFYRVRLKGKFSKQQATDLGEEVKSKFSAINSYWIQKVK